MGQVQYTVRTVALITCEACVTEYFLCIGLTPDGTTAVSSVHVSAFSRYSFCVAVTLDNAISIQIESRPFCICKIR